MNIGHRIERMYILALAIQHEDEDVALLLSGSLLKDLLHLLGCIFGFSTIPQGDDAGCQCLLYCGVAETTASEVVSAGSGVARKEIAPCGDVGDHDQHDRSFLFCRPHLGLR